TIGSWGKGTVSRERWGSFYIEQRVVNGWTFSSPARGGSVQREAHARAGYTNRLRGCLDIEVFAEKRSFNFADPNLADLYTKSKRVGAALSCTLTRELPESGELERTGRVARRRSAEDRPPGVRSDTALDKSPHKFAHIR